MWALEFHAAGRSWKSGVIFSLNEYTTEENMKVAKRTAQAFASIVVLSLLMTGSVFAYSTRLSHISSFAAPSPLADDKSSTTHASTSETEHGNNQVSETTHTNGNEGEHTLEFKLVKAVDTAVGKGDAEVQIRGTDIRVGVQIEQALKNTQYLVTLVSATSSFTINDISSGACTGHQGFLMTNDEGEAEAKITTSLSPNTYFLALVLCSSGSTIAFVSDPLTGQATITQSTTKSETEETDEVNAKQEDQKDQDDIKSAEDSKEIPSVVEVSSKEPTVTQLDSKFSVSVSRPGDNALSVSIA